MLCYSVESVDQMMRRETKNYFKLIAANWNACTQHAFDECKMSWHRSIESYSREKKKKKRWKRRKSKSSLRHILHLQHQKMWKVKSIDFFFSLLFSFHSNFVNMKINGQNAQPSTNEINPKITKNYHVCHRYQFSTSVCRFIENVNRRKLSTLGFK